jgi:hypothetical protein
LFIWVTPALPLGSITAREGFISWEASGETQTSAAKHKTKVLKQVGRLSMGYLFYSFFMKSVSVSALIFRKLYRQRPGQE